MAVFQLNFIYQKKKERKRKRAQSCKLKPNYPTIGPGLLCFHITCNEFVNSPTTAHVANPLTCWRKIKNIPKFVVLLIFLCRGNWKKKRCPGFLNVWQVLHVFRDVLNHSIMYHYYLHSRIEESEAEILRYLLTQLVGVGMGITIKPKQSDSRAKVSPTVPKRWEAAAMCWEVYPLALRIQPPFALEDPCEL